MTTANEVIAKAASQVGYYARPGTPTKYGIWYGLSASAWCAMFVSWVADQVGALGIIPKHAYTPSGANWFKARGQWHNGIAGIRRGDIAYFDFPDNVRRIQHVAFVESVNADGSVNTIEGNTSGTGSQSNGGALMRKRRKSYIVGYGRPAYSNVPSTPSEDVGATWDNKGYSKEYILARQRQLKAVGYPIDPDGYRGDKTIAATIDFQKKHGLDPDGIPGPATEAKLNEVLSPPKAVRPNCTALQRALRTPADNAWGAATDKHADALREASAWGGFDYPWGKAFTQGVVGAKQDGVWGPASERAHNATTAAVQQALKNMGFDPGRIDSTWGDNSERAYQAARNACHI